MTRNMIILLGFLGIMTACGSNQDKAPEPPTGTSSGPSEEEPRGTSPDLPENPGEMVGGPAEVGPSLPESPEMEDDSDGATPELPNTSTLPFWQEIFQAASSGPEVKGIQAYDYQWNVKPASIVAQADGSLEISGRLSHHIPAAPDDQLDYRFIYRDGLLVSSDISIQAGGWLPIAEPILEILSDYTVTPIPLDAIIPIIRNIEERIKGKDWQTQGQKLASRIALSLYQQEMSPAE